MNLLHLRAPVLARTAIDILDVLTHLPRLIEIVIRLVSFDVDIVASGEEFVHPPKDGL